jgi:hypothetical protein
MLAVCGEYFDDNPMTNRKPFIARFEMNPKNEVQMASAKNMFR